MLRHQARKFAGQFTQSLRQIPEAVLPRKADYAGFGRAWRQDLMAGITVGIVALPLALGFGVASGMGATAGLITAIVAGVVAGVFGGSNYQISGPTGAMTVVLIPLVSRFDPSAVYAVSIIAGVLVILMGLLGLGNLVALIPLPVVEGFTFGIGVIIAMQQVPLALDTPKADGDNSLLVAFDTLKTVDWTKAWLPLLFVLATIAIMRLLAKYAPKAPASLIAVVLATVVTVALKLPVDQIGELPSGLPAPSIPDVSFDVVRNLGAASLAVALLAALESLLSARVADTMAQAKNPTQPNRELVGQGLANVASGFFMGMPATGAIARTAVNVRSGARTRMAAIIHALVLAAVIYLIAPVVGLIPLSALGGVLLMTAGRMMNFRSARVMFSTNPSDAVVYVLTILATIIFDLVVAVQIGVLVAAIFLMRNVARSSGLAREAIPNLPELTDNELEILNHQAVIYRIDGALFFGGSEKILEELTRITNVRVIIIRLASMQIIDATGADVLAEAIRRLRRNGKHVYLVGMKKAHQRAIDAADIVGLMGGREYLVDRLDEACYSAIEKLAKG